MDDGIALAGEEPGDTGAVRARALDPEGADLPQAAGPSLELSISLTVGHHAMLTQPNTLLIDGHSHMLVLVGVNPDDHPNSVATLASHQSCHLDLLKNGCEG
jgi:hypothetical protein